MSPRKPRLGRGLDALLGATDEGPGAQDKLKRVAVELLQRGRFQPRTHMDKAALKELAASIKAQGILQPILVRERPDQSYEIIAGERRWRAAQLAGIDTVPVVVRKLPDQAAIAVALIENIQREDLNPVEEAAALQRLIDEFGLTHQQAADSVGRSRAAVSNLLRLLALDREVLKLLERGKLEMGHARPLLALSDGQQRKLARQIVSKGLSARETEQRVRRELQRPKTGRRHNGTGVDPSVRRPQDQRSDKLGARVSIHHGKQGGRLVIEYHSLDELDGILKHIQ